MKKFEFNCKRKRVIRNTMEFKQLFDRFKPVFLYPKFARGASSLPGRVRTLPNTSYTRTGEYREIKRADRCDRFGVSRSLRFSEQLRNEDAKMRRETLIYLTDVARGFNPRDLDDRSLCLSLLLSLSRKRRFFQEGSASRETRPTTTTRLRARREGTSVLNVATSFLAIQAQWLGRGEARRKEREGEITRERSQMGERACVYARRDVC